MRTPAARARRPRAAAAAAAARRARPTRPCRRARARRAALCARRARRRAPGPRRRPVARPRAAARQPRPRRAARRAAARRDARRLGVVVRVLERSQPRAGRARRLAQQRRRRLENRRVHFPRVDELRDPRAPILHHAARRRRLRRVERDGPQLGRCREPLRLQEPRGGAIFAIRCAPRLLGSQVKPPWAVPPAAAAAPPWPTHARRRPPSMRPGLRSRPIHPLEKPRAPNRARAWRGARAVQQHATRAATLWRPIGARARRVRWAHDDRRSHEIRFSATNAPPPLGGGGVLQVRTPRPCKTPPVETRPRALCARPRAPSLTCQRV